MAAAATLAAQDSSDDNALEPVRTSMTVVEKLATEAPASIEVKNTLEIRRVPGINLDDRLRMVPGFSLFRRSSSVASHPTTQGLSLRGIGSTGASRTLVLWDGVPLNDPFGGWVYWTRVAPEDLGRVEVTRGTSTSVFGDRALGGVVSLLTRDPEKNRVYGTYEFGNKNTNSMGAGYATLWRRFSVNTGVRAFTTNGYYVVSERDRGPRDSESNVRFAAPYARWDYLGSKDRFYVKADMLVEGRKNGTQLLRNSTNMGALSGHYSRDWTNDSLTLLGYHQRGEFHSNFGSINATRTAETLTLTQSVPFEGTGGAAYWRRAFAKWRLLVGGDALRSEGYSNETVTASGFKRSLGSVLGQHGEFFQVDGDVKGVKIFFGARHQFTGRDRQFFAPSAGITYGQRQWRVRASAYRSFRAPTLNELYRGFRVGNAQTNPNADLKNERLTGVEAGIDYYGENTRVNVTGFYNKMDDLITNVTLSITPALITRQRQNADGATAKGLEIDLRHRFKQFTAEFSYLLSQSRFTVSGLRTPQIPRNQGSAQLTYSKRDTLLTAGIRGTTLQFEDDLNLFRLPGFTVVHFSVQQRLKRSLFATFVMENALDRQYLTGFSPVAAIGAPRLWRGGLRWDGPIF